MEKTKQIKSKAKMVKESAGVRRIQRKIDWSIVVLVGILVLIGILMIFSASSVQAQYEHGSSLHFLLKQLIFVCIGIVFMFVSANIDYRIYKKSEMIIFLYGANIILLVLTLAVGVKVNDSRRWLGVGLFRFQTSDITKIVMILTTAYFIDYYKAKMAKFKNIIIPFLALGLSLVLVMMQPSMSAMMTVAIPSAFMLFIGGMSISLSITGCILAVLGALKLATSSGYRARRIMTFLHPFDDITGDGWQIVNSLYAIASGGLWGVGFGKSTQKYFYISQPQNDFIFAVIAEELGLVRSLLIILVYLVLVFKLFRLAMNVEDLFAKMVVLGIGIQIDIQMMLNVGIAASKVPNTGVGLPFISYGGTSVIVFLTMIGIVLNISKYRKIRKKG